MEDYCKAGDRTYHEVENQSGTAPLLDLNTHVAIIYVTEDADYRNIK